MRNNRGGVNLAKAADTAGLGAKLAAIDDDTARRLQLRGGVAVTDLDENGRLAQAGIRDGFIILGINGRRVADPKQVDDLRKAIEQAQGGDKVLFVSGIYPTGKAAYYAVPLED